MAYESSTENSLQQFRLLAEQNEPRHGPAYGRALYQWCQDSKNAGGPITEQFLARLDDGISLHRRMLGYNWESRPQLGLMLLWLGHARYQLGWTAEARDLAVEGVAVLREVVHSAAWSGASDVFPLQLALGLAMASTMLTAAEDNTAAVEAAKESVASMRTLSALNPGRYEQHLAGVLHTLCSAFRAAGCATEIERPARESVEIARRLVEAEPSGAHARLVANGLDHQLVALADQRRWAEALPVAQEAVRWYQDAHRRRNNVYSLNYPQALNNLTGVYLELGDEQEARMTAYKAGRVFIMCARKTRNVADMPRIASDIATRLNEVGLTRWSRVLVVWVNQSLSGNRSRLGLMAALLRDH